MASIAMWTCSICMQTTIAGRVFIATQSNWGQISCASNGHKKASANTGFYSVQQQTQFAGDNCKSFPSGASVSR